MCKCQQCFGLREFMLELTGRDHGLPAATGCQPLPVDPDPCDGSMICECGKCASERAERVQRGVPRPRQPWETRRAA